MNLEQYEAWSVVVDTATRATDALRGVVTMPKEPTPEALAIISKQTGGRGWANRVYGALYDHLCEARTGAQWHVTGYVANGNGNRLTWTTVVTPAERTAAVQRAVEAGCTRIDIEAREVAA